MLCLWLAIALAGAAPALAQPAVTGLRVGEPTPGLTRFVLDLSEPVQFNVFLLPEPARVVVDLPDLNWTIDPMTSARTRGLVTGFRYGQFQAGKQRMVLDLGRPAEIVHAEVLPPRDGAGHRLVVDLRPVSAERFQDAVQKARPPEPAATRVAAVQPPPLQTQPRRRTDNRRVVVIDPGHGGVDPGAIGTSGVYEKEITLTTARELRAALQKTGRYRVILTRDGDEFLELRRRVDIARSAEADLFISIHADSIENTSVRGGTVYTLSQTASDKEAEALATKENKADIIAGIDLGRETGQVTSILIDLAQRETMNHSASFAQVLVREMEKRTTMHRNGHRFAGFRVLKAPDVPSVLVELGYLSSAADEKMLTSRAGRQKLVEAMVKAIDAYLAGGKG